MPNTIAGTDGNYSLCAENLSGGRKLLTLAYSILLEGSHSAANSGLLAQIERLDLTIKALFTTLNEVSTNVEKQRTRETVHFECIVVVISSC